MFSQIYALLRSCIVSIWTAMKSIEFAGTNVAEFSISIVVIGVFLSIFLSFVNVNNVRTTKSSSRKRDRNKHER